MPSFYLESEMQFSYLSFDKRLCNWTLALMNSEQLWLPEKDSASQPLFCGFGGKVVFQGENGVVHELPLLAEELMKLMSSWGKRVNFP